MLHVDTDDGEVGLEFRSSAPLTLGVELELGIVEPDGMDLAPGAPILVASMASNGYSRQVKAEITTAMIEINSSVHDNVADLREELLHLGSTVVAFANRFGLTVIGGGTHPFQEWADREIYPTARFRNVSSTYGYLAQQFTVFGQHVHVGCPSGDQAIHLTQELTRYVPHLIALSAASPFWRGVDTGYHCCRLNVVSSFPLSGCAPRVATWAEFERFFLEMRRRRVVESMKDFYWDVRPKPEFGTVEVRVCDTPLRIADAADIAALVQALAAEALERPPRRADEYFDYLYDRNRFQACRYGLDGEFIDPQVADGPIPLRAATASLLDRLQPRFAELGTLPEYRRLQSRLDEGVGSAAWLRERYQGAGKDLREVVRDMSRSLLLAA